METSQDQQAHGTAAIGDAGALAAGNANQQSQQLGDPARPTMSYNQAWETLLGAVSSPGTVPESDQQAVIAGLSIAKELVDSIRVLAGRS